MNKRLDTEVFINRSRKVHGNRYDYSISKYIDSTTKIKIKCKIHGIFEQLPFNHFNGHGCKKCGNLEFQKYNNKRRLTTKEFIKRAKKIHGDKYDYSITEYNGRFHNINVICNIHGKFTKKANDFLCGHGCKKCGSLLSALNRRLTTKEFIKRAKKIHGDKYDYSITEYKKANVKIKINCDIHGMFYQKPYDHLFGSGCPKCNESKGEKEIRKWLENNNIKFVKQKKFKDCINPETKYHLYFDFYLPKYNLLIEFDGEQHYRPITHYIKKKISLVKSKMMFKKQKQRDELKTKFAKNNDIRLLRISYKKINDINKILKGIFKNEFCFLS